jgi:uncharacterized phage-associated protein
VKAVLAIAIAVAVVALAVAGLLMLHVAHSSAFVIVHKGQPLPKHYIEAWSFGNVTIVQTGPSTTTVTLAPWS